MVLNIDVGIEGLYRFSAAQTRLSYYDFFSYAIAWERLGPIQDRKHSNPKNTAKICPKCSKTMIFCIFGVCLPYFACVGGGGFSSSVVGQVFRKLWALLPAV